MKESYRKTHFAMRLLLVFACLAVMSIPMWAQTTGSIVGTVTDPSGAVIPNVAVTLTNIGTTDKRTAETDANGNYRFVSLTPANYRLDYEIAGFKHLTRESVTVAVESVVRIDVALAVGNVTDTVEVTAETPLLQTESSSISHVVESKTVQEMPLNGRNIMNMIALVPGIVPQSATGGSASSNISVGHTDVTAFNNYQVSGGLSGQSAAYLDGAPLNASGTGGSSGNNIVFIPVQDSVQEFRVATNNASVEYGRYGGGVISMASKSGTNSFHGSAYEYFRNTVLNANDFFANKAGSKRPSFNQNQYGATIGGPIRKDKTFFFFNWERFKSIIGQSYTTTVPTDAERAGDFSSSYTTGTVTDSCGTTYRKGQIFDPVNTYTATVNGKTVTCRQAFANNIIPANRINSTSNVMLNVLKYFPSPNTSGSGYNFFSTPNGGAKQQQFNARIDENLSDKHRIFGRFSRWTLNDNVLNRLGNITANSYSNLTSNQIVLGDTYSFSPTLIMDNRLSYSRTYNDDYPPNSDVDMSQYGSAWASLQSQTTYDQLVRPVISGYYDFGGINNLSKSYRETGAFSSALTKMSGRHTVKFGGEIRLSTSSYLNGQTWAGVFTFDSAFTSINNTAGGTTGSSFASFFLGYPSSGTIGTQRLTGQYAWYQGYYVGDTFQVNSKLTLNYGVRWELPGAWAEKHDSATVLLPNATDPLSSSTGLNLKGQLALVNSSAYSDRTTQQQKYDLFAPRVGFAYRVTNSTVIRAGYGISYLPMDISSTAPSSSTINTASTAYTATGTDATVPSNSLSSPFPANGITGNTQQYILQPASRNFNLASLEGLNISGPVSDEPYSYTQQWNFNIQRELKPGLLFEIGYVGSIGLHLPAGTVNLNQLDSSYFSLGSALASTVTNPMYGKLNSTSSYNSATIRAGQLLRPYPQFNNVQDTASRIGTSKYNSMQVRMEKRFGAAGVLQGSYSWSKIMGNVDSQITAYDAKGAYQDYNAISTDWSLSSFDVPHRVVASYVMELPFGKGKKFAAGTSGVAGKLISGWSANGIVTLQSGYPIPLTAQSNYLNKLYGAGTIRPNYVAGCVKEYSGRAQDRLSEWFNTSCFTQPDAYSFGTESRNDPQLRGDGVNNVDFTLSKNTAVSEKLSLKFNAEFFNLFNRTQFAVYNNQLGTSTFGTVTFARNYPRIVQFALRLLF